MLPPGAKALSGRRMGKERVFMMHELLHVAEHAVHDSIPMLPFCILHIF